MALTNTERQKRWVEKHRALHNLRRRESRNKKKIAVTERILQELSELREQVSSGGVKAQSREPAIESDSSVPRRSDTPAQLPEVTVSSGKFPKMVSLSSPAFPDHPSSLAPPMVYRDDYNRVITKGQWERLQRMKEKAKQDGYEIDGFSQL